MPIKLVRRHGSEFWYIRGTLHGVKVDESTGLAERDKAEAVRTKREWDIIKGEKPKRGGAPTFLDAFLSYVDNGGERRFLEPLLDHFGGCELASVGQLEVEEAARKLYPNRAPSTINRQVFTPVAAILRHAAVRGMVAPRPFERPRQPKGRVRWLTPAEADRLLAACAPHLRPLVTFLLYTGARMGEALKLDWRDVDLQRAHAAFLDTKTEVPRGVPLHPRVVAELANIGGRAGAVFRTDEGRPYPVDTGGGGQIKTGFAGACRRAKIKDFHPHDCRHTWATWFYAATRDINGMMALGGWKSITMVTRYTHVNVSNLSGSVQLLPWSQGGDSAGRQSKHGATR